MSDKDELIKELQEKFKQSKKELGFSTTFEQMEETFFIKDAVLNTGFVSDGLERQLTARIVDTLMNWNNYLHSLLIPNPQSMINMHESKMFNESNRKEIINLITKSMGIISLNTLNGLTKDKKKQAEFIDNAYNFWKQDFKPELTKIMDKVNKDWNKPEDKPVGIR